MSHLSWETHAFMWDKTNHSNLGKSDMTYHFYFDMAIILAKLLRISTGDHI